MLESCHDGAFAAVAGRLGVLACGGEFGQQLSDDAIGDVSCLTWRHRLNVTTSGNTSLLPLHGSECQAVGELPVHVVVGVDSVVVPVFARRDSVFGLGDGGAHYGMICDGSYRPSCSLTGPVAATATASDWPRQCER